MGAILTFRVTAVLPRGNPVIYLHIDDSNTQGYFLTHDGINKLLLGPLFPFSAVQLLH